MEQILTTVLAGGIEQFFRWVASVGGFALAVPVLIEGLKRWKSFPVLDQYSDTINRVVAVLAAAAAANGISYAHNGVTGDLLIHGLTALGLAKVAVAVAAQFGLQEAAYRLIVKSVLAGR